jgi:hypothetical protein
MFTEAQMKDSKILEKFFEQQHRQWKKEAYTVLQSTSKEFGFSLNPKNHCLDKEKTSEVKVKNRKT